MSSSCWRLPVFSVATLGSQGCGSLGGGSSEGGVCDPISHASPSLRGSCPPGFLLPWVHQRGGSAGGDTGSSGEGCGGACVPLSGVLQPHVRGHEGDGWMEAHHRPLHPQQICCEDPLPYGDEPVGSSLHSQGGLDDHHRPEGCLPSGPHSSLQQEVSQVCCRRKSLAVQGSLLRAHYGASSVHEGYGSDRCLASSSGCPDTSVSGRLAHSGFVQGGGIEGKGDCFGSVSGVGSLGQSGEVFAGPSSDCDLFGDQNRFLVFPGFPDPSEDPEVLLDRRRISVLKGAARSLLEGRVGSSGLLGSPCPGRYAAVESSPACSQEGLGFPGGLGSGSLGRPLSGRSSVVVRRGSSRGGSLPDVVFPRPNVLVRRFRSGVGGHSVGLFRVGSLVGRGGSHVHQCEGTPSGREGSSGVSGSVAGVVRGHLFGQHDSCGLSSQAGRHFLSSSQFSGSEIVEVGGGGADHPPSPVHPGEEECGGGRLVQAASGDWVRMDPSPGGVRFPQEEMASDGGSFCQLSKSPLYCLFCNYLGPHGCGSRCHAPVLGRSLSVCVSSFCYGEASAQQAEGVAGHDHDVDSSVVVPERVVSGPSGDVVGASGAALGSLGSSGSAPREEVSPEPPKASTSCVETLKRFARAAGFSSDVARRLTRARRGSSLRIYQSKWSLYRRWCFDKGHSVSNPSIPKVAEFLLWLWRSKGLSLSAIKGYRSMLSAVFKFRLPDLGEHHVLRSLLRSFAIERPRKSIVPPPWDLDAVLRHLMSDAYEPLSSQSLRSITKKTLFLVALATAKRVGELQALSRVVSSQGADLILTYVPHFLAKTERADRPLPRHFPLKSLRDFAGDLEEGSLLCPVRALRLYLKRTKGVVALGSGLFVSPSCPTRTISKNAISFFLREVISGAGAVRGDEGPPLRAHSIRGVASSSSFFQNWSVQKVLEAATWRSNSVFASFYFRDLQYVFEDWKSLGPFVAAGSVVGPS